MTVALTISAVSNLLSETWLAKEMIRCPTRTRHSLKYEAWFPFLYVCMVMILPFSVIYVFQWSFLQKVMLAILCV